ncbi:nitroreductase [Novosphingobium resinovorum]|uniref:NADH dehydrogenase n=1 Tax=Novosphingobium resinovorum TaxID=158500 RepID=A0A1D8AEH5_9SPHN|nr:nitroreductase [Novosphingobium resinovorum]AOR80500.1 NADH dehydrogenase [Novosphingobium resinovorum]
MTIEDALHARKSVRAFLPDPIDMDLLRRLLAVAARAPSGGNVQPWQLHVLTGPALARFREAIAARIAELPRGEEPQYPVYPPEPVSPYAERIAGIGEALYGQIGIDRADRPARRAQFARNFAFFGAPVGLMCCIDRRLGPAQWAELGMYLQSLMLLLTENGLASCPQGCWAMYPETVGHFLDLPDHAMLFAGLSIGKEDPAAPINGLASPRVPVDAFARFHEA